MYSTKAPPPIKQNENDDKDHDSPMARRFAALAEDALLSSPNKAHDPSTISAISDDLKQALAERIASAAFASENAQAISIAKLPPSASKHTRDLAAARPWGGEEAQEDAVLRMLVDAHKPLKSKPVPQTVDLRPQFTFGPKPSREARVESARDKTLEYKTTKDYSLNDDERAQVRAMFRDRFQPGSRSVASVSALMSLADQRIEDARARGQFDDIPRGKPRVEDHNATSPYLDTTEYFLNKIIRQQEILPPWVEKQQELGRAVSNFRTRLREDWRRLVARNIASQGGTIEEQCRRADEYAEAEARRVRIYKAAKRLRLGEDVPPEELEEADPQKLSRDPEAGPQKLFRDPNWEKAELKYNTLAVENLNQLTRSYNMMAPEVARKPIFTLEKELNRCFAEVAPLVATEIRDRARWPTGPGSLEITAKARNGGTAGKGEHHQGVIHDSVKPNFGFKELWKGLFGRK